MLIPVLIFQIALTAKIIRAETNAFRTEDETKLNAFRTEDETNAFRTKDETSEHRAKRQTALRLEKFSPCEDDFMALERFVGLPFEEENYFNASVPLEKYRRYLPHAELDVVLDAPATVTVDPTIARVHIIMSEVRTFNIRTHSLPSVLNFTVRSAPGRPFPNLQKVELSGKAVCINPKKWTPTLLGQPPAENEVGNRIFTPESELLGCGRPGDGVTLITNGAVTEIGQWPWHVALYTKQPMKYRCGGSIISASAILTAAHCTVNSFRPIPASVLMVVAGKYHLKQNDDDAKEYQVNQVVIHSRFNPRRMKNDIALLKLAEAISFSESVQPVCLWNFQQRAKSFLYGKNGTLVGWGSTAPNTSLSETLRSGDMTLVSDTTCLLSYAEFYEKFVNENTFCAGTGGSNGTIACNGDSGGGLFFEMPQTDGSRSWYLRGVVSVSVSRNGSCDPGHYTVFTDTVTYLSWVREHM